MAFSFYASLKGIPKEMRETARVYRFNGWQRFRAMELPSAAIGLIWNSMMSVAGGWFFLMACEMFVLGDRDFRLPGLGSYLQTAASAGDTKAVLWGVAVMVAIIVLLDQFVWRPVIAWGEIQTGASREQPIAEIMAARINQAFSTGFSLVQEDRCTSFRVAVAAFHEAGDDGIT